MIKFQATSLYEKVQSNKELEQCILDIRKNSILLGDTIKALIPGFTDHSINHMDSLWCIAESVFTKEEIGKFSVSEAFVLCASFYFHDLGMSLAATKEGIKELERTDKYNSTFQRAKEVYKLSEDAAKVMALRLTSRYLHADNAMRIVTESVPGLDKFIIENKEIRINWSNYIGEISASHHWSIGMLEQKLGQRGVIPSPIGDNMDVAFIACALRIIDYAHINSDRANYLEKILRFEIDDDSLLHWKAQENINGPSRFENKIKYVSNKPIEDVEAWWLFYDMAIGLDREIIAVSEYLYSKTWSKDRFSLEGVFNVKTPKNFSTHVRPLNFEPIDIRFKPDSIERLVDILGGKTLYGNDVYAPLRELIQNSRDAILLRAKNEEEIGNEDYVGKLNISVNNSDSLLKLTVKDNGVGMTATIVENYLLGIASDYWNSEDFYFEFPNAKKLGFSPTGKFGIGFLSVFMIGEIIMVESERKRNARVTLNLKGLGKHGSLITSGSTGNFGSMISIIISKQDPSIYNNLEMIVKARAPMLTFPIKITTSTHTSTIEPNWWKISSQKEFFNFTNKWETLSFGKNNQLDKYFRSKDNIVYRKERSEIDFSDVDRFKKWPDKQPEIIDDKFRLLAIPNFGKVILCSRGIAVEAITLPGLTGFIEIENLELTASRNQTIKWDKAEFIKLVYKRIKPFIVESLDKIKDEGMITARFGFIKTVGAIYGLDVLLETNLPWITIMVPPGDTKLFNTKEAITYLSNKEEILISYGTGPWSTEEIVRGYFPSASDKAVVIPINKVDQPTFGSYRDNEEIIQDALPKHFQARHEENETKYLQAIFLITVLNIIGKSWKIEEIELINADWVRKKDSHLCTYFKKSNFL